MTERDTAIYIKVANLIHHPDNPRKDLGDLTEMVESVKKNGIMQNLTIIPISCVLESETDKQANAERISESSQFYVLIGNRRLEAARIAGLERVPCRIISNIDKREQVSIMLEENMQRNDLTVWEQAQGFQLMLDLGETEETIAQKTGFGRTTIRHRLNIAKLDGDELKKKEAVEGFQLSLTDLYELEKVSSLETRNEILREAGSSRELASMAIRAAAKEKRDKNADKIIKMAVAAGMVLAEDWEQHRWDDTYKVLLEISDEDEAPESIDVKEDGELFYARDYRGIRILKKNPPKKEKKKKAEDLKRECQKQKYQQITEKMSEIKAEIAEFIRDIVEGRLEEPKYDFQELIDTMIELNATASATGLLSFIGKMPHYSLSEEEKKKAKETEEHLSVGTKCLIFMEQSMAYMGIASFGTNKYNDENGRRYKIFIALLEKYGFKLLEGMDVIDGTSELYK